MGKVMNTGSIVGLLCHNQVFPVALCSRELPPYFPVEQGVCPLHVLLLKIWLPIAS